VYSSFFSRFTLPQAAATSGCDYKQFLLHLNGAAQHAADSAAQYDKVAAEFFRAAPQKPLNRPAGNSIIMGILRTGAARMPRLHYGHKKTL